MSDIRLSEIIADSRVIERGEPPNVEYLSYDDEWTPNIFDALRFELHESHQKMAVRAIKKLKAGKKTGL